MSQDDRLGTITVYATYRDLLAAALERTDVLVAFLPLEELQEMLRSSIATVDERIETAQNGGPLDRFKGWQNRCAG